MQYIKYDKHEGQTQSACTSFIKNLWKKHFVIWSNLCTILKKVVCYV